MQNIYENIRPFLQHKRSLEKHKHNVVLTEISSKMRQNI